METRIDGKLFQMGEHTTPTVTHTGDAADTSAIALSLAKALVSILAAKVEQPDDMEDEEC